jgi:polysaccharide export outer membrane protein
MSGRPGRNAARAAGAALAGAVLALAASGCRVNLPPLAAEPPVRAGLTLPPPPPGGFDLEKPYPLLPGDSVDITVRDDANLNISIVIPPDGVIEVWKSEGEDGKRQTIPTKGMTVEELKERIAEVYRPKFITKPYVQVVANYVERSVCVRGAVKTTTGIVALPKGQRLTLYRAIQMAGLDAENADLTRVSISRKDPVTGTDVSMPEYDLVEMDEARAYDRDPPLEPNDIVNVPVLGKVSIWGHVENPGPYRCERNMTVIGLISAAGGGKEFAKLSDVRVVRTEGTERERTFRVDVDAILDGRATDPRLVPGDRVWVAEGWK